MMQPNRISDSNKWRTLLACTAGRPIDPDVFPEPSKNPRSSRKARRDRFLPLQEKQVVGVGRSTRKAQQPPSLENNIVYHLQTRPPPRPETVVVQPFAELVRKAVSPSSPSKSQTTRATATTISSSTANEYHPNPRRDKVHSKPDRLLYRPHQAATAGTATTRSTGTPSLTITASSSFGEDVSFLSFHIDDEDSAEDNGTRLQEQSQQLQFWRRRAGECFDRYGIEHCQTATAFLELGLAHVRCEQYTAAQDFFRTAHRVFEKQFGPKDLRVAKTLEALGVAQSRGISNSPTSSASSHKPNKAGLLLGLQSQRKCFRIRYDVLGSTHIDTVETLNKIANIYMRLQMFSSAKTDYLEVLTLRTAILGHTHPSVAVAAQSLGMAHLHSREHEQAKAYFLQALHVCALSGLEDHPMAEQLRGDIKELGFALDRVEI